MQTDTQEIEQYYEEVLAALNSGDVDHLMELSTDDCVEMPDDLKEPHVGKEAVRARIQSMYKNFRPEFNMSIEEIVVDDRYAFVRSLWHNQWTPLNGGDVIDEKAKMLSVLQRQADGSWKNHRNMFNHIDNHWPGTKGTRTNQ